MSETKPRMKIDATRAKTLASNFESISRRVSSVAKGRDVRLVAVSKLKQPADILALHQSPVSHKHFGENYAQELIEKANLLPSTIKWHFIGGLQSNKCKSLSSTIPNLWCVSSVDTVKKANQLNIGRSELSSQAIGPLNIHVQINTSGEESKSGVSPGADALELCRHIHTQCEHLHLLGLMTIGAIARSKSMTKDIENEDFSSLKKERDEIAKHLNIKVESLELSMGMSADFEGAIDLGSDEVRIGSDIFGERPQKADFKVKSEVEEEKS